MAKITEVHSRQILDSRGDPTVETRIVLDSGVVAVDSVPSGASKGIHEAIELRDEDPKNYNGKSVYKAVENVNKILTPKLIGLDPEKQFDIDHMMIEMDGTANKANLGANSILSVSMAIARASARNNKVPLYKYIRTLADSINITPGSRVLPTQLFNVINGGKHGAGNLTFQEYLLIPASNKTFSEGLKVGAEIYHHLKEILVFRNAVSSVGDEGGYAPNLSTNIDALEAISEAIRASNYHLGVDVFLGLDLAASVFLKNGKYQLIDRAQPYTPDEFIEYLSKLKNDYNLLLFEDPFGEEEWDTWSKFTQKLGDDVFVVGDDILCTNEDRLKKAIEQKACNSALIKLNQIGTVTETLDVIKISKDASYKIMVSHRSGETNDDFASDFAVGVGADYVKFGAPARGERVAKYNRLLEIETALQK